MAFPDFFVIGAPKSGTTALHAALATHPSLFLSPVKEPKFFLCDGPPPTTGGPGDAHSYREWIWRQEDYEALFAEAPAGQLRGESTPFYLSDPAALARIAATVPHAKLIAVLRDPVDRAYSNWAHLWADGLETIDDFEAACAAEPERVAAGWAPFWRYLGTGKYAEQLDVVDSLFPKEQLLLVRYRDLVDEPADTLGGVCHFLGVDEHAVAEVPSQNVGTYVAPSLTNRALRAALRHGAAIGHALPTPTVAPGQRAVALGPPANPPAPPRTRPRAAQATGRLLRRGRQAARGPHRLVARRVAHLPGRRDVLGAQVVGAVAPRRLVVEALASVGEVDDRQVPQRTRR